MKIRKGNYYQDSNTQQYWIVNHKSPMRFVERLIGLYELKNYQSSHTLFLQELRWKTRWRCITPASFHALKTLAREFRLNYKKVV